MYANEPRCVHVDPNGTETLCASCRAMLERDYFERRRTQLQIIPTTPERGRRPPPVSPSVIDSVIRRDRPGTGDGGKPTVH